MENGNHKYLCWLAGVRGIGKAAKFALLRTAGEANLFTSDFEGMGDGCGMAAKILYTAPEEQIRFFCSEAFAETVRGKKVLQALLKARKLEADRIEEELEEAGIRFMSALEKGFPAKLKEIPDPPFGIYYKGSMPAEEEPAAAIIGARLASGYGREQARRFGRRIGARGISVISGMARGVDGIAQKAALDAGGKSYAVLGCGVDLCYPEENRELYERLLQEGGVLSEYPPGTFPEAKLFPPRNRIISGLSDLVLVIEARKKSGTLITVDMALEQGRDVYALPGRVCDSLSDGCNRLIRQGAGPATCPEDILEFFFGPADSEQKPVKDKNIGACPDSAARKKQSRPPLEDAILKILAKEGDMHIERIREALARFSEYDESEEIPEGISPEISSGETADRVSGTAPRIFNETLPGQEAGFQVSVNELIAALMHLKLEGKVREVVSGYYCISS